MNTVIKCVLLTFVLLGTMAVHAQNTVSLTGKVTDKDGLPIITASVGILGRPGGTVTDENGNYSLEVPVNESFTLVVRHLSHRTEKHELFFEKPGNQSFDFEMDHSSYELIEVKIEDEEVRKSTMTRLDPKVMSSMPNPSGQFEAILKTFAGVSSNNELSSQYSVRGGNFDENLVYVNDVLIYRPFLIRSGQQEGLSFINSDMVSSVLFSAGGFDARYGDKMSSVLDVKYRRPYEFGGSGYASLLGAGFQIEDSPGDHRFSYTAGFRYKTNQYILNSLDTEGQYKPAFTDFQTFLSYDMSESWEVGFLGNVAFNRYQFIPETRQTEFGTFQQALRLTVFFEGQEISNYETYFGALTNRFQLGENHQLKVILSSFQSFEDETFDIHGAYFIDELENDVGEDNFGDVAFNRGVGGYIDHARNYLEATVINARFIDRIKKGDHRIEFGASAQREIIDDDLSEWAVLDSAGHSLPKTVDNPGVYEDPSQTLVLSEVLRAQNRIESMRYDAYVQDAITWEISDSSYNSLTGGIRVGYWDFNDELIVSPRATFSHKPAWKRNYLFRLSTGYYYQPPFYREMRDFNGRVNEDIKSQESIHFVFGTDYNFLAWQRPFKFTGEAYFKLMDDIIPYVRDNVRIRYFGTNNAKAYATGLDFKINGEFVKGVESWFSLSLMKTEEDLKDDFYIDESGNVVEPGYIPRPTDQRLNFSLFFQDYLPKNPTIKMNLTLHLATGLPFGPPNTDKYLHTLRYPPYRRVDIGLGKLLVGEANKKSSGFRSHFKSMWLSLEVFNLFGISNTISYLWVKDITNASYAVPNFLTQRQVNLRLHVRF